MASSDPHSGSHQALSEGMDRHDHDDHGEQGIQQKQSSGIERR
jgi:hypothetical protein